MHSRVFEINDSVIPKEERGGEYSIPDWFTGYIADYTDLLTDEKERYNSIMWVAHYIKASFDGTKFVISKENLTEFLNYRLKELIKAIEDMNDITNLEGYCSFEAGVKMHFVDSAFDDKYGFWILYDGEFMTLDAFMKTIYRIMSEEETERTFYVGSIWDYHY